MCFFQRYKMQRIYIFLYSCWHFGLSDISPKKNLNFHCTNMLMKWYKMVEKRLQRVQSLGVMKKYCNISSDKTVYTTFSIDILLY